MMACSTPSRLRRVIAWGLTFLLLGSLTTYTIAFIAAFRQVDLPAWQPSRGGESIVDGGGNPLPLPVNGKEPPGSMYFELRAYEGRGITYGMSRLRPFQNYTPAAPPVASPSPRSIAGRWERDELLPWTRGARPWPDPTKGDSVWVKASGWPLRATVTRIWNTSIPSGHTWHASGGLIIGSADKTGWADWPPTFAKIIPLRPLWPEFLANSLLFACAWAAPVFARFQIRRLRRRQRGHCLRCGYNLSGLPADNACPECGSALQKVPA